MQGTEIRAKILKLNEPRKHKIKNSIGVYDVYKRIRKNKWMNIGLSITEKDFYLIIRTLNNYLGEQLILGRDIVLPNRLGTIEIRKKPVRFINVNGKLTNTLPVDWDATLKLWVEDELCRKNKVIVKLNKQEIFKVGYNKSKAIYNNKIFYTFTVNRELRLRLGKKIKKGLIDAFLRYEY